MLSPVGLWEPLCWRRNTNLWRVVTHTDYYDDERLLAISGQEGREYPNQRHNSNNCSQPPDHQILMVVLSFIPYNSSETKNGDDAPL